MNEFLEKGSTEQEKKPILFSKKDRIGGLQMLKQQRGEVFFSKMLSLA